MDGIVSFLDSKHNQLIEELWAELKQEFSVYGVYITPYPHFSYHVAQDYDVDKVEPVLQRITSNITTFKVRTTSMEGLHRRPLTPELLKQVYRVREQIMQGTNGKLFEDSTEIIRQQREERTRQLLREDEE